MTMSESTNNITVIIAGRPYPLRVKEGDEPIIRRIVKEVNDKISLFQNTYPRKDRQDWMSMALLTATVDLHKVQATLAQPAPVPVPVEDLQLTERLSNLDVLLSEMVI